MFRPVEILALALAVVVGSATGVHARVDASPAESKRKGLGDKLGIPKKKKEAPPPVEEPEPEPEPEPSEPAPTQPPSGPSTESPTPPTAPAAPAVKTVGYTGKIHKRLQTSCAGCHKAGGSAGSTKLVLTGEVGSDYRSAKKLVDPKKPTSSALLTKAAGKSHLGGTVFAEGSSSYTLLREWIAAGAPRTGSSGTTPAPPPAVVPTPTPTPGPASPTPAPPRPTTPEKKVKKSPAPVASPEPPASELEAPAEPVVAPEPAAASDPVVAPEPAPAVATPQAPPSRPFAPEVHDALTAKCKSCHGTGAIASKGAFALSGNVVADYHTAVALVDTNAPATSRLLTKATGREHGGGPTLTKTSPEYVAMLAWVEDGARGPTAADVAPPIVASTEPSGDAPIKVDATTSASPTKPSGARLGDGTPLSEQTSAPSRLPFSLPFDMRLNGKLDFSYERRDYEDHPFQRPGRHAFQTYHHFLFLSRAGAKDPFGFNVELITQAFYEFNARIAPKGRKFDVLFKGGKILVPFGNEPLFHKSYGGRSGFDQEILPIIWAQPGLAASVHVRAGPVAFSNDLYTVQGYALRAPEGVLNLQSDVSSIDSFRAAIGDRVGASWGPLTGWYSFQFNRLGFDRLLFMQAVDLEFWRLQDVPVLKNFVLGLGGMRADVSGAGPGEDYYHFGSYLTLGYYPIRFLYLQYRAGLRTTDNRRGLYFDSTRLDERDRSSHNLSIVGRYKGFYTGLQLFWNLEKANELHDDFLRWTVGYEF